jgi:hypothetical protein
MLTFFFQEHQRKNYRQSRKKLMQYNMLLCALSELDFIAKIKFSNPREKSQINASIAHKCHGCQCVLCIILFKASREDIIPKTET